MPVVRMPDGTNVSFPDDMPKEEIRGLIASKFPEVAQPKAEEDTFQRSTILPLGKDTKTGEISLAVPGIIKDAYESGKAALTLPGRAMSGEMQVMGPDGNVTPQAIAEGLNFAMWGTPASPASNIAPAAAKMARPKPDGLKVAEAGQRLGVDLPRAATSDMMGVQQVGKNLTSIPIAGTPLRQASEKAIGQVDDAARTIQQGYGSGSVQKAGSAAREGLTTYAKETIPARVGTKYDAVDSLVSPNVLSPLRETTKAATDILGRRSNAKLGSSKAVDMVRQALETKDGLNYQGIKDLRSAVGELLDDPAKLAASGAGEKELKRVYAALSDDLRGAVLRGGGEKALSAFERANTFAAKKFAEREALQKILGRQTSDEGIFEKIKAMAGSTSRADMNGLVRARGAVGKETWDELASAVISNLGRDTSGNFSPERFITGYGKLSKTGKHMLFNSTGKADLAKSLDDIATVSQRFKRLDQFANPSGTAQNMAPYLLGAGAVIDPTTVLTSVGGGRVLSSMLAKPVSAKKIAAWAKAYEQAAAKPGAATSSLLAAKAEILAAEIAAESGTPALASQIAPLISRIGSVPADQRNENNRAQENKQGRVKEKPRQLAPNEI